MVGVDVSCSALMEGGSIGVLPLRVTCVFLTVAALRSNGASVICDFSRLYPPVQREIS